MGLQETSPLRQADAVVNGAPKPFCCGDLGTLQLRPLCSNYWSVAAYNARTLRYADRYIFSSKHDFEWLDKSRTVQSDYSRLRKVAAGTKRDS